jgi:hypothetical protein
VLLQDVFANENLDNALSIAPTQQALGAMNLQASVLFVDACQQISESEYDLSGGRYLRPPKDPRPDTRVSAPIYFAAPPGGSARGAAGEGTYFSRALLDCFLSRAARVNRATTEWTVSKHSLDVELPEAVRELAPQQDVLPAGRGRQFDIHRLPGAPTLPLKISFTPAGIERTFEVSLRDAVGTLVTPSTPITEGPFPLPCGTYTLRAVRHTAPIMVEKTARINHEPPTGGVDEIDLG